MSDNETDYWHIDEEELKIVKEEFNITVPETPSLSLWNKIGLKPVIIILLLLLIWSFFQKSDDDEEDEETEQKPEQNQPTA